MIVKGCFDVQVATKDVNLIHQLLAVPMKIDRGTVLRTNRLRSESLHDLICDHSVVAETVEDPGFLVLQVSAN